MSEVERYDWDEEGMLSEFSGYKDIEGHWVKSSDYDALAAQRDEGLAREAELQQRIARLEQGLKFYAEGHHLLLADADVWDTCSGEPINFLHDDAGTASVEDGSIAKQCLASPGCTGGEKS